MGPKEAIATSSDWKTVDSKRVKLFLFKYILVSLPIDLIPAEINRLIAIVNCEFLVAIERQWKIKINEIRTFESAGCDGRQLIVVQKQSLKRIGTVCDIECARFD